MNRLINLLVVAAALSQAAPAHAAGIVALPDLSGMTLFALGVAGVLVGRHVASSRKD